jgi:hypothetical protein
MGARLNMMRAKVERLGVFILITLFAAGCGGPETSADRVENDTAVERPDATTQPEVVASDNRLNAEYLAGEWCSREAGRTSGSGTTWIFAEDGSYRMGRGDSLADGGDVDTFLRSVDIVSVEPDAFVVSQLGTNLRFERGSCAD